MNRWPIHLLGWGGGIAAGLLAYQVGGAAAILLLLTAALAGAALITLWRPAHHDPIQTTPPLSPAAIRKPAMTDEPSGVSTVTLLEATLNSMREGVVVVDPDTRILASNAAARSLFDSGNGKLESRRLIDVTRQPLIHDAFRTALETGERAEVTVETQGNSRRVFELRVAPLAVGEINTNRGAIGVFFDVTRLEALERTRQEFLSNVSHELRTPLTAIMAFVETLEDGAIDDPENNHRFLEIIRKNASRMHDLIDDILDLSLIESGQVNLELKQVRLAPIVKDVCASVATRAESRRVSLRNEVSPEVQVTADPRRLEQMLTNLIDNAVKFNREGGSVVVSCEGAERARIAVTDTGEGITPEQAARIFERFYRVDRARSRDLGGSGLGLAIVKHLARAHGGEAYVRSTPGEGSTFTIELPNDH